MKKITVSLVVVLFSLTQLFAQESTFNKGDKVVNLGIGLGSTLYSGIGNKSVIPPLSVSFETGIVDNVLEKGVIGVGGYLGYQSYKWGSSGLGYNYGYKYSNIIIGARGNFHYPLVDKLDTYTGLMLGYNISSAKWTGTGTESSTHATSGGVIAAWFVGARYYFGENFAVMAELGYGITYLNLGVALKF